MGGGLVTDGLGQNPVEHLAGMDQAESLETVTGAVDVQLRVGHAHRATSASAA